jgi:hypothetical protein
LHKAHCENVTISLTFNFEKINPFYFILTKI